MYVLEWAVCYSAESGAVDSDFVDVETVLELVWFGLCGSLYDCGVLGVCSEA